MQAAIRAINADKTLSQEDKSRRIHELFIQTSNAVVKHQQEAASQSTTAVTTKPCEHYQRHCDIETPCCNRWYSCRICHDEAETGHTLVRASTKLMKCRVCGLVQPVSSGCSNQECTWKTTRYYCERCRLWEDNPAKDIYHCDGCGICRVGKREQYWHCTECNLCLPNSVREKHKCVKGAADDTCVCGEYMQTSTRNVCHLPCGHTMHYDCRDQLLLSHNVACPKCRKSIVRNARFERELRNEIRRHPMPPEFRRKCQILCNDCEKKTVTKFHWMGVWCTECKSFNTAVIETYPPSADDNVDDDINDGEEIQLEATESDGIHEGAIIEDEQQDEVDRDEDEDEEFENADASDEIEASESADFQESETSNPPNDDYDLD